MDDRNGTQKLKPAANVPALLLSPIFQPNSRTLHSFRARIHDLVRSEVVLRRSTAVPHIDVCFVVAAPAGTP